LTRTFALAIAIPLGLPCVAPAQSPQEPPRVVPVYLVPRDYAVPLERIPYHVQVVDDVWRWYGRATGGRTFIAEPLIVQLSRHTFTELAADSFQAWWPLLQREFADYGLPWNRRSKIKLVFLTNGAGAWAGADSENGGIDSIGAAGRSDDGDWGGLAVIGDSSAGGVFAGVCPEDAVPGTGERGRGGGTAWWCSGTTYRGTLAHELGHTFGLPHPDAFRPGFRCADSTAYSQMQCHWEYARERLFDYEIAHLRSLSFFASDTVPAFTLLTDVPAVSAIRWRRARLESGDRLTWMDGRGGGTGYPWAVLLEGQGAAVTYAVPAGATLLALDLGVRRGGSGTAAVRLALDGRPVALHTVVAGAPAQRVTLDVRRARRFAVEVASGDVPVVLGNPRVYLR
jgi:hypothetical protein